MKEIESYYPPRPIADPVHIGVYACRVDDLDYGNGFHKDVFLMWIEGRWGYPGSDQWFRGTVHGWTGPLPRTNSR